MVQGRGNMRGVKEVQNNILNIFNRRRAAAYAISQGFALEALNDFRREQSQERYWVNQTNQAMDRMFAKAFLEKDATGWSMSHGVEYGAYLELANNGKNQAIKPTVDKIKPEFFKAIRRIYS